MRPSTVLHPVLTAIMVVVAAPLVTGPALGAPIDYTFTLIAGSPGFAGGPAPIFDHFGRDVALNEAGSVAFYGHSGFGTEGFFTGSGGPATRIVETNRPFPGFPSLNDGEVVAFEAAATLGGGIQAGSGGPLTTIYAQAGGLDCCDALVSINNAGTVTLIAGLDGSVQGVFLGNGGPLTTVVDTSGPFAEFTGPVLNTSGLMAFGGALDQGGSGSRGLFTASGGTITPVVTNDATFARFGPPALNDLGVLAFWAELQAGGFGIFTAGPGGITTVMAGGPFGQPDRFPAINTAGIVAFLAELAGGEGIFTGPDPIMDRVLGTGDPLFGSTVAELGFFREGLNDGGQLAFWVRLLDDRTAIVRADLLVSVPAPGAWLLLVVGVGVGWWWTQRSHRRRDRAT